MLKTIQLRASKTLSRRSRLLLAAVATALAAACGATESAGSGGSAISTLARPLVSSTLVPGVIVEPTRGKVYLMGPAGGIATLNIDDGILLWKSNHADQPLFVDGENLLAMVDLNETGFVVAFLDSGSGKPVVNVEQPTVLPLPAGVTASIDQTLERTFKHALRQSDNDTYLTWDYLQRDVTGVAPPGGMSSERRESGTFRLVGNTFEAVALESIDSDRKKSWPRELRKLDESQSIRRPPWRSDKVFAIVEQRYDPEQVVLQRWRASDGKPLEGKLIYEGRSLAVVASCDENHIVVATANVRANAKQPYILSYYDIDSGELQVELPSKRSAGPFCLFGSRLLSLSQPEWRLIDGEMVATPLELVAFDVPSGALVWRRAVRDTTFRGLAPPAN